MSSIRSVQLELLRAGPAHNQLLSTLTPYIALCGPNGPTTVHVPFEHQQLLTRLERLRYGAPGEPISASQRQAEVRQIGEDVGKLFGSIPALLTELSQAGDEQGRLLNLRLSITAYELGLIPFETAISPDGIPGSGSRLQLRSLVSITREVRRGQPLPVEWNRKPKILFAYASPPGLAPVPAKDHLMALRRAIDPWVAISSDAEGRLCSVKQLLTVLPDATLEKLRDACRADEYTHVHLLAHGASFKDAGNDRYGIALLTDGGAVDFTVVDGERLAIALMGRDASGRTHKPPTLVSLATCDSGNVSTVLVPGGSIAHELHTQGVPWVIASQFPLWMRASSLAAEVLYTGLLAGADPRWVLHDLRQRLRTEVPDTHDWASIVAYATIAPDLTTQVEAFHDRQVRARLEVRFARIDEIVSAATSASAASVAAAPGDAAQVELDSQCDAVRAELHHWCGQLSDAHSPTQHAERLGVRGASEKRIAIACALAKDGAASLTAYQRSLDFYQQASHAEPVNHWVVTQVLSLLALPQLKADLKLLAAERGAWWIAARQIASWQLQHPDPMQRVWARATLAELELLGAVYAGPDFNPNAACLSITRLCRELREQTLGQGFPRLSVLRQFRRYANDWPRDDWQACAEAGIAALGFNPRDGSLRHAGPPL